VGFRAWLADRLDVVAGTRAQAELPSRSERRLLASERHREGGPLWTNRDRHLNEGKPDIGVTADTGGLGKKNRWRSPE
jgi:hypothetical protein